MIDSNVDTGFAAGVGWPQYLTQIWILTAISMSMCFMRWGIRIRTVGIRGLQGDDFMTIGVLTFMIMDAAVVTVANQKGQNVDIVEADLAILTTADIARLEYGSKVEYSAWWSYVSLIFCLKFTMLFFYKRLTLGSFHGKVVKILFWVVGVAYIINVFVLIFGCFPTQMNWQVSPIAPWKCTFRPQNFIANAVLNISTDLALLAIPVPMLWKLKMPMRKKIVIACILSSGLFVIAAAIVRLVLSLDAVPSAANINSWGVRETFIGVFTVNIPIMRPLFTKAFWAWGPYDPTAFSSSHAKSYGGTTQGQSQMHNRSRMGAADVEGWKEDIEMGNTANITGGNGQSRDGVKKGMIMQTRIVETTEADEDHLLSDKSSSKSATT